MSSGNAQNVEISPINLLWQKEAQWQFDLAGLTAGGLGGTYFTLNAAKDATEYYVWFDENSTDADPAPAGKTGIEVDYAASASASVIATAMASAIDTLGDFSATASGTVVTVDAAAIGNTTDPADVDSGVAITVCYRGQDLDFGLLQDVVDLNFAPSNFIVNAQQYANTPLAALFTGYETIEMSLTMLETKFAQLQPLYELYGGNITPSGGTQIFGAGTNKIGENLLKDAARLIAKPVNATDNLSNTVLPLAIPVPDTLSFSGTEPRTLSVTMQGFADLGINTKINTLFFGDHTQTLT